MIQNQTIEGFRLSPQQKRLWLLQERDGVYHTQSAFLFQGMLDRDRLRQSIQCAADRHEALRTIFHRLAGMDLPIQVVLEQLPVAYREVELREIQGLLPGTPQIEDLFRLDREAGIDLQNGPLVRFTLASLAADRHLLCVTTPTLCSDALTHRNLVAEVEHLYEHAGDVASLGEVLQYLDFSEWQHELLESEEAREGREFWRRQLADDIAELLLPWEEEHGGARGFVPERVASPLGPEALVGVEALAAERGVSIEAVLLAAWLALLGRSARRSDLCIGKLHPGRKYEDFAAAHGLFARCLPLRFQVEPGHRFADLAAQAERALRQADEWQEYFSWEDLSPDGGAIHLPFAFEYVGSPAQARSRARLSLLRQWSFVDRSTVQLRASATNGGLELELQHDPSRLVADEAAFLLERLIALLSEAIRSPAARIADVAVLGQSDRRLLSAWNDTALPVAGALVHRRFEEQAARTPDTEALLWGEEKLTFAELNRRANRLARHLARVGVGPGGRTVIALERSAEQIVALLATWKAGAGYVPVDPFQPAERLRGMLEDVARDGAATLIATSSLSIALPASPLPRIDLDSIGEALARESDANLDVEVPAGSPAYVIFTSGSTGRPKGAVIRHESVVNLAAALRHAIYREVEDGRPLRVSVNAPLAFDASVKQIVQLLHGHALVPVPEEVRPDGKKLLAFLRRHRVDVLDCTPAQLGLLLDAGLADLQGPPRLVLVGGEGIPTHLWDRLAAQEGRVFYNVYGPTECTVDATVERIGTAGRPSLGRPIGNVRTYVVDERQQLLPPGLWGELLVGGAGLALGYFGRPDLTAAQFVPDAFGNEPGARLYRTGDQVRLGRDGILECRGRLDHQVKLRGHRIELGEIESVLAGFPAVERAVAVLREDAPGQARLVAYVAPRRLRRAEEGLHLLPNGLAVAHQNRNETEYLFREIFENRCYVQHGVELPPDACVLDVGANIGMFSLFVLQECAHPRIYAFEPLPAIFDDLSANCGFHAEGVRLFNFGLSDRERTEHFTYYPHYSMMSGQSGYARPDAEVEVVKRFLDNQRRSGVVGAEALLGEAEDLLAGRFAGQEVEVRLRRLSDVLREEGIERVDLLKIDVQRAEMDVLAGIDPEDWPRIAQVVLEVHDAPGEESQGRLGEIRSLLERHGFSVVVEQDALLAGTDRYNVYAVRPGVARRASREVLSSSATRPGWNGELSEDLLRRFAREWLPESMVPAAIVILPELPLTRNGKVDRAALPQPEEARSVSIQARKAPRDAFEEVLAAIWAELLGRDQIGVDESFFDLGGHSLLATQVVARVRQAFQVELPLRALFEDPTIQALAARIQSELRHASAAPPPLVPVPREGELRLSFTQQRFWFLQQLEPGSPAYNCPKALRIEGGFDFRILGAILDRICFRHEVLRTRFPIVGGRAVQEICEPRPGSIPIIDLRSLPEAQRQEQASRLVCEEALRAFDLARDLPFRARLLHLAETEHVLLLTLHHIAADAWSLTVLDREIREIYRALIEDREPNLPDLKIQYADFAHWQRNWMRGEVLREHIDFWRQALRGMPAVLDLPMDRPRPPMPTYRGASLVVPMPESLSGCVEALGRKAGVTPFMVLLSTLHVLLSRLSGQEDLAVGAATAARNRIEIEPLIGCFINTLVLRGDLSASKTFWDLLQKVRETTLGAYMHQDLPFEKLVDELQPARQLSVSPFFQVFFDLQREDGEQLSLPGLKVEPLAADAEISKFELMVSIRPSIAGWVASFRYAVDLFDAATVQRMAGYFASLAGALVSDPDAMISEISLLSESERDEMVRRGVGAALDVGGGERLQDLFEEQARRTPEAVALVSGSESLSYVELDGRAERLARRLRACGVAAEVRVGVFLSRSPSLVVGLLGVLKASGAYVPLDPAYPRERLSLMLEDSGSVVVVSERHLVHLLPAGTARVVLIDEDRDAPGPEVQGRSGEPGDLAYVIYTSGSTGRPKGVAIEHRSAVALLHWARSVFSAEDLEAVYASTSVCFDLSVFELFVPLSVGGRVILGEDALALSSLPEGAGPTLINTVPSAMSELLRLDAVPPSVRVVNLAGEPLRGGLADRIHALGTVRRLLNLYGPTEDTTYSTWAQVERGSGEPTIGRQVSGTRAYVLDAHLRPVPIGVSGELFLAGAGLARCYLRQPAMTADRFVPDPLAAEPGVRMYRTGDLVRWREDGDLELLGRLDHQVKVRGYRIELGEVEAALLSCEGVEGAVAVVREESGGERRIVAYVVGSISEVELRERLRQRLPAYMVPALLVRLESLPRTPNGKIDRGALPSPEGDRPELRSAYVAPRNSVERHLASIWSQVLGIDQVGVHDDFFELGGDSILSIQIVARANQSGLRLTPRDVFEHPTIAGLASLKRTSRALHAEQGRVHGPVPLTPAQHWFLQRELRTPHHYNQSLLFQLPRPLSPQLVARVVRVLLQHHDMLRLRLLRRNDEWHQEIAEHEAAEVFSAVDLSRISNAELRRATLEQAVAALQTSLRLATGPIVRFTLLQLGPGEVDRLFIVIHHLAIDGLSWRVLLEDLRTAYEQLAAGAAIRLPAKTTSFQTWARRLREVAASAELLNELPYWLSEDRSAVQALPVDFPSGRRTNTVSSSASIEMSLDRDETLALLQKVPRAYRTRINDVLLAAMALALRDWTGHPLALVELEGHGRQEIADDIDTSRTVGWFTSFTPVLLDLRKAGDPAGALKAVKEQLRRLPRDGFGYGLLRHLSSDASLRMALSRMPQAEVSFNYWGQVDQALSHSGWLRPAPESAGSPLEANEQRPYLLDFIAAVADGRLGMFIRFSQQVHLRTTVESVGGRFLKHLRSVIAHCSHPEAGGYTPSDFPLLEIGQEDLDVLLTAGPDRRRREVEDAYPLSPMQEGMLFHSLYEPGSSAYICQHRFNVENLDIQAFESALTEIVHRHAVLRTAFLLTASGRPIQVVDVAAHTPLVVEDWRELARDVQSVELDKLAQRERRSGFDLARPPLLRLVLVRISESVHHLVWTHHHLLLDGWSVPLLIRELGELYRAAWSGEPADLTPPRTYRAYIALLKQRSLSGSESFWRHVLRGFRSPTPLPSSKTDPPRTSTQEHTHLRAVCSDEIRFALEAFGRRHRLTGNTIVSAAWAMLLGRYAGTDDVVFGSVVSGRPPELEGVESMIGLFINTLPLRVHLTGGRTIVDWLLQLQAEQIALREFEHTPLVEIRGWSEMPPGVPLFQSLFVFESYPVEPQSRSQAGELRIERVHAVEGTSYPLNLMVSGGDRLSLKLEIDPAVFDAATQQRLLSHLSRLLAELPRDSERCPQQISLLSESEREEVVRRGVGAALELGGCERLEDLFEEQARRTPEAVALVGGSESLSYAELDGRAERLARRLRACGVAAEVRVGVFLSRSPSLVVGLLGVLKAGGAYVPLDPAYPGERLSLMLEDSGSVVVVSERRLVHLLPAGTARVVLIDEDRDEPGPEGQGRAGEPGDLAYVIYTSGSTGRPKGVAIEHRSAVALLHWARGAFSPEELEAVYASTSVCFDLSVFELFVPLSVGGRVILGEDALALSSLPEGAGPTLINTVPSAMSELLRLNAVPPSVRVVNLAGEPLRGGLADRIHALGTVRRVLNLYGPTEDTTYSTWAQVERGSGEPTIGRPVNGTRAYVLDAHLRPVPIGVVGELFLGGAGLARCYLGQPAMTAERFVPDPLAAEPGVRMYRTGDLVRWREDGELELLGRLDHQVKVRGYRIELGEVEAALLSCEGVEDAVAVVREESGGERRIVAYVVGRTISEVELRERLRQRLPAYMVPALLVRLESLPRTPNGKVDRGALPSPEGDRPELRSAYVAPRNSVERHLASIWSQVLGIDQVGVHDDFFELGGDSILSIQIVARANQSGLRLTPRDVFEHPTIAGLASLKRTSRALHAEQGPVHGVLPLTPVQRWFFEQHLPRPDHFNQSLLLALRRPIASTVLRAATAALLEHHDVLRLRFASAGGGWRQEIAEPAEVPFCCIDLSAVATSARQAMLEEAARRIQGSLDLVRGPIARFVLFHLDPAEPDRFLMTIHHLAVDGVSWRVLLEDLQTACSQIAAGGSASLPEKTTSYKTWAERLASFARTGDIQAELPFWLAAERSRVRPLSVDRYWGPEANTVGSAASVSIALTEEETRALLQEVPRAYRTQINDVLLAAVALGFQDWTGEPLLLVDLEGHGREEIFEDVDVTRTVGWFTTIFPVLLDTGRIEDPGALLKSIKEQLRRVPGRGLGYGLLRYLSEDPHVAASLSSLCRAEVSFNYLGQVDQAISGSSPFSPAVESPGPMTDRSAPRPHLLDLLSVVEGGRFVLSMRYSSEIHDRASIESLGGRLLRRLRELIEHCLLPEAGGFTPSDFPLAALDQAAVDRIAGADRQIEDIYPITPIQLGMLLHSLQEPDSEVYVEQVSCAFRGDIDLGALTAAWNEVVRRHSILRSAFVWEGLPEPLQVVRRDVELPLDHLDWSGLSPEEARERFSSFLRMDRTRDFDLSKPPLIRLTLIELAAGDYRFVWTTHHAVTDGWSTPVVVQELLALYGRPGAALPASRPFRDYIAWLRNQDPAEAERFWRAELAGIARATPLELGTGDAGGERHGEERAQVAADVTDSLARLARQQSATLSTVVQAALAVLLCRYSGEDDVIFGVTVSGRPASLPGVETIVGPFINTLPLRARVPGGDEDVASWLRSFQKRNTERQRFEHSASVQTWSEIPLGLPLFNVLLVFENYRRGPGGGAGSGEPAIGFEIRDLRSAVRTRYPLNLVVFPGEEIGLYASYSAARFESGAVRRLLGHLDVLLEAMGREPHLPVGDLPLLTESERKTILGGAKEPEELLRRVAMLCSSWGADEVAKRLESMAGPRLLVLDRASRPLPIGVPGELCVASGSEPLHEAVRTGELARFSADGGIELLGAREQCIEVRGRRLYPGRAEELLRKHPGVANAAVLAGHLELVAFVVPEPGAAPQASEMRSCLARQLPAHMVPTAVFVLPRPPRTAGGLLDRRALRRSLADRQVAPASRSELEKILLEIWREVLGVEDLGVNDAFLDLGGHSLLAMRLASRLREVFRIEIPLRALFEAPTVEQLALRLEETLGVVSAREAPTLVRSGEDRGRDFSASFAQQRLWFLDQLEPGNPFYTHLFGARLRGPLDAQVLEESLAEVVRRHEVLRTALPQVGGQPVQRISPPAPISVPLIDLSALEERRREEELQRLLRQEALRPFDLSHGPLLRPRLLRLEAEHHAVCLTMHHVVMDAWSLGILARELTTLYRAFSAGLPSPLPELPVQYADFAEWQRQYMSGDVLSEHLDFWRRHLAGDLKLIELPARRARPARLSYRGARLSLPVEAATSERLLALGRRSGATPFMVLLSAFAVLLSRTSGQEDIVLGMALANRSRKELENLIGFFINTLPLRLDLSGSPRFLDLLRRVREICLEAFAHQDFPLDKLIEAVRPDRSGGESPLFRITFGVLNAPLEAAEFPGLQASPLGRNEETVRFDLTVWVVEAEQGLRVLWTYSTDLFEESEIRRMHARFERVLESIAARPEAEIDGLEVLTEIERRERAREEQAREESRRARLLRVQPKKVRAAAPETEN